jgi:hypothetical protein
MSPFAGFVATEQRTINREYLLPGNIIPTEWYKRFTGPDGPDLVCLTLLGDIVALYRLGNNIYQSNSPHYPQFKEDTLSLSYEYFENKFSFSKERSRRALVRLEALRILKRDVCNIELSGGKRINRLVITLDPSFFNSCFRKSELDIRVEAGQGRHSHNLFKNLGSNSLVVNHTLFDTNFQTSSKQDFENLVNRSPRQCGDHIVSNKKNYKENRSMANAKSNFLKKFSKGIREEESTFTKITNNSELSVVSAINTDSSTFNTVRTATNPLHLKDFYPLSEEDCSKLQVLSGRDFSLRAMNEILLDMSSRLKDKWFKRKKNFLNYMSKAFRYEMRDAVKISNETFRIKNNLKIEDESLQKQIAQDLELKRQEAYLTELEYSLQVTPEWHLKKKLASTLERSKAYNLLTSYTSSRLEEGKFTITLCKHVDLSEFDRKIILEQVKATQGRVSFAEGEIELIDRLEIIMPESQKKEEVKKPLVLVREGQKLGESRCEDDSSKGQQYLEGLAGLWSRIRKQVASFYGQEGQGIDRNWFSKLEPEIDEGERLIKLKAPSNFIRDWVSREYGQTIEEFFKSEQYNCLIC